MKRIRGLAVVILVLSMLFAGGSAFAEMNKKWDKILNSSSPVKIYIEDIKNISDDDTINVDKVKEIVSDAFTGCKTTDFVIVDSPDDAELLFKGTISDYVWSQKAPVTNIFPPAALALDVATKGSKNWARMELDYKIYEAGRNELILDYETQVTIKKPNVPKGKSYELIYLRAREILARDMFKRSIGG